MNICGYCFEELHIDNWTIAPETADKDEEVCDSCWKEQNPTHCNYCYSDVEEYEDHPLCPICKEEYCCPWQENSLNSDVCLNCQDKILPKGCERCGKLIHYKYLKCLRCGDSVFDKDKEVIKEPLPKKREKPDRYIIAKSILEEDDVELLNEMWQIGAVLENWVT